MPAMEEFGGQVYELDPSVLALLQDEINDVQEEVKLLEVFSNVHEPFT